MSGHIRVRAGAIIIKNNKILLTEFNDPYRGVFYDLPAGGTEPKESIIEAVIREAKEEANIDIEVGPLAFVYEYAPHLNNEKYGKTHTLVMMFECTLKKGSIPRLPDKPDPNQTGVKWIPISELENVELYAKIGKQIKEYIINKRNIDLLEEHKLLQKTI
ncbi:NUDIX domain-containing protein [Fictibacillus phosphorivorans]|uniref:NUDIX domain-containing protein n=1 Tax=Fictibacillus phosphorivorans TaxID=1221500 RepID=UPI00203CAE3A|nr:NUDIX domain-containing protein [Fictibacillus phosphorivorans]MCM3718316.1 NUDIX domain-containing protein [Fictibacillus phosphorivorans]MCM3775820.1 NUDIX domain-containing protein [Fictibacillus phosphorivorans]